VLSFDEILREISEVTPEQIKEIARQILPASPTLAVVGPFRSTSKFERLIK
jgi:predicted Zn-dependent peptidase